MNPLRLVNLQGTIIDMRRSLSKVIRNVDALFAPSEVNWLVCSHLTYVELLMLTSPRRALVLPK